MTTQAEEKIPVVIRNEFFYAFARVCMIVATLLGLPFATFLMNRVIAKADEISDQVAKQNVTLQIMSSEVKYRFDSVTDHENRLRALERK